MLRLEEDVCAISPMPGVTEERRAADIEQLLEFSDSGLALFDESYRLIIATRRYAELCGYCDAELQPGVDLRDLVALSLRRGGESEARIAQEIRRAFERLQRDGRSSFDHMTSTGLLLRIERQRLDDGRVVDSVREVSPEAVHSRMASIADAARMRMVHAMEAMADGFALFDSDDRFVAYNKRFIDLNPAIADVIAPGRSFEAMLRIAMDREGYAIGARSQDEYLAWRLDLHRNPGEPFDLELSDGRWVRVHERRTSDGGIVKIRSDITQIKKHELEISRYSEELKSNSLRFDVALNNMVQGLCMFAPDQTLIVCNRRYLEMYGFSPNVVKPGIKLSEIMDYSVSIGNYSAEAAEKAKRARPDHARRTEQSTLKQFLRDGRVIAVMHQPMPDGGSVATYQDVTELERHEERIRAYTKELEASNRELEEFAYVASHDLQEPLRKIETFGDRLVNKFQDSLPDQAQTYISRMQNATSRMRLLINDLLSYSRVSTQAKAFEKTDLRAQCELVVSDLEIRIRECDGVVEIGDLPTVDADPVQMRQLMQNLISNALKFQRPDVTPIVKISATNFSTEPITGVEWFELRIADNGIGFDNKYKKQIFTIFQRLHGRNEYEGTGIGLATVRKIVERHGGEIDADGVEGQGATFIVTLPTTQSAIATLEKE